MSYFCKRCGTEINDNIAFCPRCGSPQDSNIDNNCTKINESKISDAYNRIEVTDSNFNKQILFGVLIIIIAFVFGATYFLLDKSDNKSHETAENIKSQLPQQSQQEISDKAVSNNTVTKEKSVADVAIDYHWCRDSRNGVLIWNPNPTTGETVTWQGGYISDGSNRYADGNGVATWYLNGEYEQRDEGTYHNGVRDGVFVQYFPDGRVKHSRWVKGTQVE